jgi:hypothetical protein
MTAYKWKDYVEHVKDVKAGMWKADEIQDNIKRLIINSGDNASSEDSADSDQWNKTRAMTSVWRHRTSSLIRKVNY